MILIGFYFNENSTGGAFIDYHTHKEISKKFADNFLITLLNFDKTHTRHSPVLLILFSVNPWASGACIRLALQNS